MYNSLVLCKIANKLYKFAHLMGTSLLKIYLNDVFKKDFDFSLEDVESWENKNPILLQVKHWFRSSYKDEKYLSSDSKENNVEWILFHKPSISSDFFEKQSYYLQPTGKIPPLWLFLGNFQKDPIHEVFKEKNVAQYYFIIEPLKAFFKGLKLDLFKKEIANFIETNKSKIDKITNLFDSAPKMIGNGLDGFAYSIGKNKVLKIFMDPTAFFAAKDAMHRLHKQPELAKTEAMIYDVGLLGRFENSPIYYYVMERMVPVRSLAPSNANYIKDIVRTIIDITNDQIFADQLKNLKKMINNPIKSSYIKSEVTRLVKEFLQDEFLLLKKPEIKHLTSSLKLRPDWLSSLIEEILMKFLTSRGDLHTGNLGVTNFGTLRYFDPSHENWTDRMHA